ncbi:hypothetical protein BGZ76_001587 [Entomortierella beljakovae]|nr:hypothetical protein BGZ76_001587 [Entomortierella beljakovae]
MNTMNNSKSLTISPGLFASGCLYEARKAPVSNPSTSSSHPSSSSAASPPITSKTRGRPADDSEEDEIHELTKRPRVNAPPPLEKHFSSLLSISGNPDYSVKDSNDEDMDIDDGIVPEFDGDINDLIRELERTRAKHERHKEGMNACVKKIRELSIVLASRFRSGIESPTIEQPLTRRRNSMSSSAKARSKTPTRSARETLPPPPPPPAPTKTTVKRSPSSTRATIQHDGHIPIASSNVVDTFYNTQVDVRNKVFARKPRNMVMPNSISGAEMEDIMVTSAMDGSLQFWDIEKKKIISNIPQSQICQPWSEDICWVDENVLATACAHQAGADVQHQLTLIHTGKNKISKQAEIRGASPIKYSLQPLSPSPHDIKGSIMCISAIQKYQDTFSLATAGSDKRIFHWQFESERHESRPISQTLVHNKHTAMIQAMSFSPQSSRIYTGGSDCKIIGWDMNRSVMLFENKGTDRINTIDQNPVDPNLFLVSRASLNNQLSLYDTRQGFTAPVLAFGIDNTERLTRQIKPSWHPNGGLVSSGMQSGSKINIWDIRWIDVLRGPGQSINPHGKHVLKAGFHPTRSILASMSTDCSLAFTNYDLNQGTVVNKENQW